jgi:hypothetical protein
MASYPYANLNQMSVRFPSKQPESENIFVKKRDKNIKDPIELALENMNSGWIITPDIIYNTVTFDGVPLDQPKEEMEGAMVLNRISSNLARMSAEMASRPSMMPWGGYSLLREHYKPPHVETKEEVARRKACEKREKEERKKKALYGTLTRTERRERHKEVRSKKKKHQCNIVK